MNTAYVNMVLVGIDDSEPSRSALEWAATYARAHKANLLALHVRDVRQDQPLSPTFAGQAWPVADPTIDRSTAGAANDAVLNLFNSISPEPEQRLDTVEGFAGPELLRAAEDADLLVIGTQEHTGLDRVMTGSVSHYCLSHTHKPITAVPPSTTRPTRH